MNMILNNIVLHQNLKHTNKEYKDNIQKTVPYAASRLYGQAPVEMHPNAAWQVLFALTRTVFDPLYLDQK